MQIVGYETATEKTPAQLRLATEGAVTREALTPGKRLSYSLGERHCAGSLSRDGADSEQPALSHRACPNAGVPYCETHRSRWACARCRGECSLPLSTCREEHAIYLAAFAPATFKVGVTRSWRLETRLREQGADRAAHLRTVEDGRIARQIEAEIAETVGDRVRVPTKIEGLHRTVDTDSWETLLAAYEPQESYSFEYDLDIDSKPVAETIAAGTVNGTQGRVLGLEQHGTTYAVDMRELVGYEITTGETKRALQSSFAAFE